MEQEREGDGWRVLRAESGRDRVTGTDAGAGWWEDGEEEGDSPVDGESQGALGLTQLHLGCSRLNSDPEDLRSATWELSKSGDVAQRIPTPDSGESYLVG